MFEQNPAAVVRIVAWTSAVFTSDLAPLVLEGHPAARHVDHLELELVAVPGARTLLAQHRADHVAAELAAGRLGDAEVAILEERPEARADEGAAVGMGDGEGLAEIGRAHV